VKQVQMTTTLTNTADATSQVTVRFGEASSGAAMTVGSFNTNDLPSSDIVLAMANCGTVFAEVPRSRKARGLTGFLLKGRLEIYRGQVVAIVGRSGSGKSTLLNLLGGLRKPDRKWVRAESELSFHRHDGSSVNLLAEDQNYRPGDVGFVFQKPHLMETNTVAHNIRLGVPIRGHSVNDAELKKIGARFGLQAESDSGHEQGVAGVWAFGQKRASELSGGQAQRVSIARAHFSDPEILICDEPTSNLDDTIANEVMTTLVRQAKEKNQTILFVTHNLKTVVSYAERIIVVNNGLISHDIPASDLSADVTLSSEGLKPAGQEERADRLRSLMMEEQPPDFVLQGGKYKKPRRHFLPGSKVTGGSFKSGASGFWLSTLYVMTSAFQDTFDTSGRRSVGARSNAGSMSSAYSPIVLIGRFLNALRGYRKYAFLFPLVALMIVLYFSILAQGAMQQYMREAPLKPMNSHVTIKYRTDFTGGARAHVLDIGTIKRLQSEFEALTSNVLPAASMAAPQVYSRRDELNAGYSFGDCGSTDQSSQGDVRVFDPAEPLYRELPVRTLNGEGAEIAYGGLASSGRAGAVISRRVWESRDPGSTPNTICLDIFLEQSTPIAGVAGDIVGGGEYTFDIAITEKEFRRRYADARRNEGSAIGSEKLPPSTAAAVYFDPNHASTVLDHLSNKESFLFSKTEFEKMQGYITMVSGIFYATKLSTWFVVGMLAAFLLFIFGLFVQTVEKNLLIMRSYRYRTYHVFLFLLTEAVILTVKAVAVSGLIILLASHYGHETLAARMSIDQALLVFDWQIFLKSALTVSVVLLVIILTTTIVWRIRNRVIADRL
jgi:putative ABC transport system ATP-binding protein